MYVVLQFMCGCASHDLDLYLKLCYCCCSHFAEGGTIAPETGSHAVDTFPGLKPSVVQLMQRLKLFDATYVKCSEEFTTVTVVGEEEPAKRAGNAFIQVYQDLMMGTKWFTQTVSTKSKLSEDQYALLLSEVEDQHPEVVCQPQYAEQSVILVALEQSKLLRAKQHIVSYSLGRQQPAVPPRTSHINPQHTARSGVALPLSNGGMLTVKRGDLMKEKVTAIVNAANDQLDHIGGVAFAIDRASRGNVQRESRKVIQSRGHVPTGQVAVTGAGGSLQCQRVIHAVGPDANFRPHKECEQLLKLVCENVLGTAEAQGMVSVALPAISSGIYAMKKDVVAQILISTILHYPYQHKSSLKDIRIVLFEEETLIPFLQVASEAKKGMPAVAMQPVVTPPRSPDVVEIPLEKTHRKMVVKKAHFIYEDADIKVAAICTELGFQTGRNKELDSQLKGQLSEAVRRRYQFSRPDKFDVFTMHVQHAAIGCRYLVIANILDCSLGTRQDGHKYLQQILQAVCQEADTLEMPSVAIAPSTFVTGAFQSESVLPEFIHMLSQFKFTNDDFLTDVRFLALDAGMFSVLLAGAERAVGRSLRQPPQHKHVSQALQQPHQPVPAIGRGTMSVNVTRKDATSRPGAAATDPTNQFQPASVQPSSHKEKHQHASTNPAVVDDVVEIPLEKTHRKMVVKKAHFIYEDADIKVTAICSELGFQTGRNKELDGHLKGQLSEAVRGRYQLRRPDKFDVFTVHLQHAATGCRYLVIANILDRSLGTRQDGHKYLQQILHAVGQEADTLEMPSIAIAPSTFSIGGFQPVSILPAFIRMIYHFKFTNDDFLTDVRFLALDQNSFNSLVAGAERHTGKSLRKTLQSSYIGGRHLHKTDPPAASEHGNQERGDVSCVQASTPHTFKVGAHQTVHGVEASTTGAVSTHSEPSVSIPFHQGRNLTIKKGDVVKEAVVAIVNSTNEHLKHSSGVARAINEASGGVVQVALKNVVQRMGGSTQSGRVVVTGAGGNLKCKHVIHVVWPTTWERTNEGDKRRLEELIQQVLNAAEERGIGSIALPPIGSGSCYLSQEVVAQVLIDSVLHYPHTRNSLIKDIHIVISDNETLSPFLRYAEDLKKDRPAPLTGTAAGKGSDFSQPHNTDEVAHDRQPVTLPGPVNSLNHSTASPGTSVPTGDVVKIPLEKTHRKMVVKNAHFIYEDADIKVAAICSDLGFQTGVNKDLDSYLKGQLSKVVQERYQHRRPDKFDVFTVHVQNPSISCRFLVIANILDRSLGTRQDGHKYLQQILHDVCQEADTLEMPSVAIAPNSLVIGGFQKGSILPEFIRVISQFMFTKDDFFTDVRFLATQDGFDRLVADAERTVGKILSRSPQPAKVENQLTMERPQPSYSPFHHPLTPEVGSTPGNLPVSGSDSSKDVQLPSPGPGMTKLSDHVFFALACDDLCRVQADAIVVPVSPSLDVKSGVVQAVDAASNGAISRAVKQLKQTKQKIAEGAAIPVVISRDLNCKQIILLVRSPKAPSVNLDQACQEALKLAEGLNAHSVAFPPISSNKNKERLAECMMGAFCAFSPQNSQYTVRVSVVVQESDEAMLKAFRNLVGEDVIVHGKEMSTCQLQKTNSGRFVTPPESPSQSRQNPPCLDNDPGAEETSI